MFKRMKFGTNEHCAASLFRRIMICVVLMSLLVLPYAVKQTYSYFYDRTENAENVFQSATIEDFINIIPGKAKATFPAVGDPSGETKPVCFIKKDKLQLNFGEVVQGNSRKFVDVLRLINLTAKPLTITWHFTGDIESLMEEVDGSFILLSDKDQTSFKIVNNEVYLPETAGVKSKKTPKDDQYQSPYSMDIKLNIDAEPGTYDGYLVFNVNGDFLSVRIPAEIYVREKEKEKLEVPSSEAQTSNPQNETSTPQKETSTPETDIEQSDGTVKIPDETTNLPEQEGTETSGNNNEPSDLSTDNQTGQSSVQQSDNKIDQAGDHTTNQSSGQNSVESVETSKDNKDD